MFIVNPKVSKKNWKDKWFWVNRNLIGFGYLWVTFFSDRGLQILGASLIVAQTLRSICFNREDWEDYILAAAWDECRLEGPGG